MGDTEAIEQTLHIARQISVYQVPPRPPTGWKSGEWLASAKIFSGRLKVVSVGDSCEVRLEDPNSDQEFAVCPVPYGKRTVCIEPVGDSSRYFVLRVEDRATKRHAFLGLGFDQRGDAFDFNEALQRHEKFVEREHAAAQVGSGMASGGMPPGSARTGAPTASSAAAINEVASLYKNQGDLSLKEGQTIHVNFKPKPKIEDGVSLLSSAPVGVLAGQGFKLAPPPGTPAAQPLPLPAHPFAQASSTAPSQAHAPAESREFDPFADFPVAPAGSHSIPVTEAFPAPVPVPAAAQEGWATFD